MSKPVRLEKPQKKDYPAAQAYLALLVGSNAAAQLVERLRRAAVRKAPARDILSASHTPMAEVHAFDWRRKNKDIQQGRKQSPILLVCGKHGDALVIADGFHRLYAAFTQGQDFETLSERSKVSKKKLADQICQALWVHTEIEEQVFYPAVRQAIKDDDLMNEALVEHAGAKDLVAQISDMDPDDALYDAKMKVLSEQIDHHVQEEEQEMFPKVRKANIGLVALAARA